MFTTPRVSSATHLNGTGRVSTVVYDARLSNAHRTNRLRTENVLRKHDAVNLTKKTNDRIELALTRNHLDYYITQIRVNTRNQKTTKKGAGDYAQ